MHKWTSGDKTSLPFFSPLHFGLKTLTNKTGCSLKYPHQAAPGEWIRSSVAVRQSYGPQVPAESLQSQQRLKHERTWTATSDASRIAEFIYIWKCLSRLNGSRCFPKRCRDLKRVTRGLVFILLIFRGVMDDRRTGCISPLRWQSRR